MHASFPLTVRRELKRLLDLPAVQHVPQPDGSVPRGAGQDGLNRAEAQAADGTLVSAQDLLGGTRGERGQAPAGHLPTSSAYLQQPARLHGPQEDLEGVLSAGAHQLSADVHRQRRELRRPRRRERPEVSVPFFLKKQTKTKSSVKGRLGTHTHSHTHAVRGATSGSPVQVERPDGPVQGGADDHEAAGREGDVGDAAGVFREGDEAEAAVGVPHFDLRGARKPHRIRRTRTHSRHTPRPSLTLPSSPPVATYWPSGEYASVAMLLKCPCCLKTYDSLCHSHTSS